MKSLPKLSLKPLDRISPSRYTSLKTCALRVAFANTYKHPLLPYAPHGHFGNVIHEAIRSILTKEVLNIKEFNNKWDSLIEMEESKMRELGFDSLLPLKKSMKISYSFKKLQVRSLLERNAQIDNVQNTSFSYENEVWLTNEDETVAGRADLITTIGSFIRITDFKSGKILEDEGDIKQDYEDQLKLYAYLFYSMNKRFPNELVVADLDKKIYPVEFSHEEIIGIGKYAQELLANINILIAKDSKAELAKASKENCEFCIYRPACQYHWLVTNDREGVYFNLRGVLKDLKTYRNGNINITLGTSENDVVISNISKEEKESLRHNLFSQLAIFNVFQTEREDWYKAGKTTIIYEV